MPLQIGDRVRCDCSGSWVDGLVGRILKLNVVSSDNIHGHLLQMESGVTVVPEVELTKVIEAEHAAPDRR